MSGFLRFKGNFIRGQNNSKYSDWAPLQGTGDGLTVLGRVVQSPIKLKSEKFILRLTFNLGLVLTGF